LNAAAGGSLGMIEPEIDAVGEEGIFPSPTLLVQLDYQRPMCSKMSYQDHPSLKLSSYIQVNNFLHKSVPQSPNQLYLSEWSTEHWSKEQEERTTASDSLQF